MELTNMHQHLEIAFIEAIGSDEIESESIFTFLIYIQLGIIKAAYPSINKAHSKAKDLLKYLNEFKDTANETGIINQEYYFEDIKLSFENNKDTLLEIIEDIWNEGASNNELKWLEIWVANCRDFLKEGDFNKSFVYLSKLAYNHVGSGNENVSSKLLISSFIQLSKSLSISKIIRIE